MTPALWKKAMPESLDAIDKKLLDIIQSGFPLVSRPYAELGDRLGISEEEAFNRTRSLKERGIIRRIGANFQSSKLGFVSTLCAAKVPAAAMEDFTARLNAEEGVTHNYEREHEFNIWFTLISPSREEERKILSRLMEETGIEIINLPATKLFKIKVDFRMED